MNNTRERKQKMIEALRKSLGVVTTAARNVGIDRTTHYDWYNKDSRYKKKVDDIQNIALDFAESSLFKQMKENNTAATIFFLKTKGKRRGYIEKQQVEHSGESGVTINLHTKTKEEIKGA